MFILHFRKKVDSNLFYIGVYHHPLKGRTFSGIFPLCKGGNQCMVKQVDSAVCKILGKS